MPEAIPLHKGSEEMISVGALIENYLLARNIRMKSGGITTTTGYAPASP